MNPNIFALMAPAGEGGSMLPLIINFVAIIAIFYFLLIRPQRQAAKRHAAMLEALKRGDVVMTDGGIIGEIVHIKDSEITVKSADTRIIVARPKIAKLLSGGPEV